MANFDVLIVGGGVIGLSLARRLHVRGAGSIAIVERGKPGHEASFAAAGMLAPNAENEAVDDFYRLCDESRLMFPELAGELKDETGIDIELDRSGTLYAAFTEEDSIHLDSRFARQQEAGIQLERLSAAETLQAEPRISENVRESLYFPNDWQVENRKLLSALEAYARLNGIKIIDETRADTLILESSRVIGITAGGRRILGGTTVLATGAWTSLIKIGDASVPFAVKPIRGQMISFAMPRRFFERVIYSPRGYLVPRADGRILAGATVEDLGFDDSTTMEAVGQLRTSAAEIAPLLSAAEVAENWAGLRPYAGDGLPVIGPVPGYDGLFAATAHYRNGILLAPITAKIVAEEIVSGTGSEYPRLFGPERLIRGSTKTASL